MKMKNGGHETKILESAMDFIHKSIGELRQDLKYSIVHFHAGLELLLKARLIKEHWSLVFAKRGRISKIKFDSGNFMSVSFSDSINRINGVFGRREMTVKAEKAFRAVAKLRNKILHFYYDFKSEAHQRAVAKMQCRALRQIQLWLEATEDNSFKQFAKKIKAEASKWTEYLGVVYDEKKDKIDSFRKEGFYIATCPACSHESMKHSKQTKEIHHAECLVCDNIENCILIECECGATVPFYSGGEAKCGKCGKEFSENAIVDALGQQVLTKDTMFDLVEGIYCPECCNRSIFSTKSGDYVCPCCLEKIDEKSIHRCEYCNEGYAGEFQEFTWALGCGVSDCQGAHGDDDDDDNDGNDDDDDDDDEN